MAGGSDGGDPGDLGGGAVAGCGGTSEKHGEAAKSAQQIAADAAAVTTHLHSFRLDGTITETRGITHVTGAVAGPGRLSFSERRASDFNQPVPLAAPPSALDLTR